MSNVIQLTNATPTIAVTDETPTISVQRGGTIDATMTDAEVLAAWESETGRTVATDGAKLDGIEAGATADQSDAEIETAYNNQVAAASQSEMEAGTEAGIRRVSPLRIAQAIAALATVTETDPVVGAVNGIVKANGAGTISAAVEDTDYQGVLAEGAFADGDKTKLDGIETGATADQSNAEIETAYNAQVAAASQAEMEAGTEAAIRRMSPLRVAQAIAALAGGGGGLYASVAIIADQKASGINGGTFTAGAWRTRDLNTEISDADGIVSISSNQFTLAAGTYEIEWSAPAHRTDRHQSKLYNATDTADVAVGTSEFQLATASYAQTRSIGAVVVTIASAKAFEIQHQVNTTQATNGFGVANSFGTEQYTTVLIRKLA